MLDILEKQYLKEGSSESVRFLHAIRVPDAHTIRPQRRDTWGVNGARANDVNMLLHLGSALGRRVAMSACGRICLLSSNAQVGDVVAYVHGSVSPLVIRHVSENKYNFVGELAMEGMAEEIQGGWDENEDGTIILI